MALGKGIPVINGFDLNSKLPLDSRTVVDTVEEMNALVTNGSVGDGQLCYCKADKKLYVLKEGAWSEVGGGGGDVWLNILPYVNGETMTISQEGFDLVWNSFSADTSSPINKYAGIDNGGSQKLFFDKAILSDIGGKQGLSFIYKINIDGVEGCTFLNIYEDKSVEFDSKMFDKNLTLPSTSPSSQLVPSITTTNTQQNLTIGNGLAIENGVLKTTGGGGQAMFDITQYADDNMIMTEEGYNLLYNGLKSGKYAGIVFGYWNAYPVCVSDAYSLKFQYINYEPSSPNDIYKILIIDKNTKKITMNEADTFKYYAFYTKPSLEPTTNTIPCSTPSGQQNLTIGNGLEIKNGALQTTGGGGGKSVPPTLNLINHATGEVRTTITEEEYNNLVNGLYNQVMYANPSDFVSMYSPSKLFSTGEAYSFVQFKIVENADKTFSYSSMVLNTITIGEKNTSNEYSITVTAAETINPPSSGGSNIDKLDIEFKFNGTTTLTTEQVSLIGSYNNKYVYVKFDAGIVGDNVYLGYALSLGDLGTIISIVSQPNISGDIIVQSTIAIKGTTATHQEKTIAFSEANSGKFLKTNAQGEPEWASVPASTITITFEN